MRLINAIQSWWPFIVQYGSWSLIIGGTIFFTRLLTARRLYRRCDAQDREELKSVIHMREHVITQRDKRIDELERENGCLQAKIRSDSELAQRINTLSLGIIQDHTTVEIGTGGRIAHH